MRARRRLRLGVRVSATKKGAKEKRDIHISVWLTETEYEGIVAMAEKAQDPPSTWLRKLALREKTTQAVRP